MLDFHIRTKRYSGWSGIVAAAIKINGDKLEVQQPTGTIFFNDVDVTSNPPPMVGGYTFSVLPGPPRQYRIDMDGGQYIKLRVAYGNSLQVDVLGHGSDFGTSEGLCANWTANSPNALVDRDHSTIYPLMSVQNAYGEEWQVKVGLGDPQLFQTSASANSTCIYSRSTSCERGTPECQIQENQAKNACINVTTERNAQENCEFDVFTTGDVEFAKSVAYTDPIIGQPQEFCKEVTNATNTEGTPTNNGCAAKGGRCVWRCSNKTHVCLDTLCQGPSKGCSCALPLSSTRAPTMKPNPVPNTNGPVKPSTRAPSMKPNPVPNTSGPVKPSTRAPTMKPNLAPNTTGPVKPSTRAPTMKPNPASNTTGPVKPSTRAPTRAPIKPTVPVPIKDTKSPTKAPAKETKRPTKAPTRPRRCRWLRRLLGLC